MIRKDKQVTNQEILTKVIKNSEYGYLGLVKGDKPYLLPLNFGFDGRHLYFHSGLRGEKVEILKENDQVCISFAEGIKIIPHEKPCEWSAQYISVICHGWAEEIKDANGKVYALKQIIRHFPDGVDTDEFNPTDLKQVRVYKVHIQEMVGKGSNIDLEAYL